MDKDTWIRKLTSRKFWMAIAGLVAGIVAFIQSPSGSGEAITALIMALGSVVAYIVGEGLADAAGAQAPIYVDEDDKPPEDDEE